MAKDGLSMKLVGGAKLDMALKKMAITKQSRASTLVYNSLKSGATVVKKAAKEKAPTGSTKDLKNSLISGLKRRVQTPRDVFLASVSFDFTREKNENKGTGGWASLFVVKGTKKMHPNNFMKKATNDSRNAVKKKIGINLAKSIAKEQQKKLNV